MTSPANQGRTARPVILGVVGDSAAGKTTITRGLVRVLGEEHVTHVCTDDYHRFDRRQRAENGITPLHPDCNHVDIIAQHLAHLHRGEAILKPVYRHKDGTFGPPVKSPSAARSRAAMPFVHLERELWELRVARDGRSALTRRNGEAGSPTMKRSAGSGPRSSSCSLTAARWPQRRGCCWIGTSPRC